ncbi:MAG TPA: DUF1700 domain-containing protein [Telluria sp.]|nr:DUF1700 domain-containing protein [Telluria sp.]
MGKMEFLDALKRAMTGLPPETQAKTLAYYEQRFVDGVAAGRTEEEVSAELDDPKKIAMTLRASAHMNTFAEKKNPANVVRMAITAVGLAFFNLFMLVPAMVYGALLTAVYACSLAFYLSGIAITASGLAGANELVLTQPLRHVVIEDGDAGTARSARINIGPGGIQIYKDTTADAHADEAADETNSKVIRGAENMASSRIHISTDMDAGSRTTQTLLGLGMVLGGIVLFLLSLVVTRYTFIGIKRYVQMNISLLKGR